jgi:hypothetical protein
MITTLALAAAMLLAAAPAAFAGDPTCFNQFDSGWANHSTHILNDYVADGSIAGGAPAHRVDGAFVAPPGASFCVDQAKSVGR